MKKTTLATSISIIILALVGTGLFFFGQKYRNNNIVNNTKESTMPAPNNSDSNNGDVALPEDSTGNDADGENNNKWSTYRSSELGISIEHPEDVEVKTQNQKDVLTLEKWGPTQREGTEFYDGISLTLTSDELGEMNFREYVEERKAEFENEPVVENVSDIKTIIISDFSALTFSVTSLGERDYIFIPHQEGSVLEIVNQTQDPTNEGFESTANHIISSIESL